MGDRTDQEDQRTNPGVSERKINQEREAQDGPEQTIPGNQWRCDFQLLARALEVRGSVLIWVSPKADPETRIWVQAVNSGGDPRKHSEGVGERDRGVKTVKSALMSRSVTGQVELNPTRNSLRG